MRMGIAGMRRQGWGLALAGALSVATAWAAVEWQHARSLEASSRHAVEDRMQRRVAQCARRIHALEIERDLRDLLSDRGRVAGTTAPVLLESKDRLGEVDKELAQIETSIADLKGRMVRIPPSAIEAIPEGSEVALDRQALQAASAELLELEARPERDALEIERKRGTKERLGRELTAAVADDLARRKNLAFKSLEDDLVGQVEGRRVRVEERNRLRIELASATRATATPDSGPPDSSAITTLAHDLAIDPADPQGGSESEDDPEPRAAAETTAWSPLPLLLGGLVGAACVLLAGRGGPHAAAERSSDSQEAPPGPHPIGRVA